MQNDLPKYIQDFCEKILVEHITQKRVDENEILNSFNYILNSLLQSHKDYLKYFSNILKCFEDYYDVSIVYSLTAYDNKIYHLYSLDASEKFDNSILAYDPDLDDVDRLKKLYESIPRKTHLRLSKELEINLNEFTHKELEQIISLITDNLHNEGEKIRWEGTEVEDFMLQLIVLRAICKHTNHIHLFYSALNIYLDRLNTSNFKQTARDVCEEILLTSIADNLICYGYFCCFRAYSNSANLQAAALYGNMCLMACINHNKIYNDRFLYEIIWQTLKFYRNINFYSLLFKLYNSIPATISITEYQRQSLDFVYFSACLKQTDKNLPSLLCEYLDRKREDIISGGEQACTPWLSMIYNVVRLSHIYTDNQLLDGYKHTFENIVQKRNVEALKKHLISDDINNLTTYLKEELLKLFETRKKDDFVYDSDYAIMIAHRIFKNSLKQKNIEAILLSFQITTIHSIIFKEKETLPINIIRAANKKVEEFYKYYHNPISVLQSLNFSSAQAVVGLALAEDTVFQFTYHNNSFDFIELKQWDSKQYKHWVTKSVPNILFETHNKRNNYLPFSQNEFQEQTKELIDNISFPKLLVDTEVKDIFLIKTLELSELPHNLLVENSNELISIKRNLTNIISLEWLYDALQKPQQHYKYDKTIWIPLDREDFTLNLLYSKLSPVLENFDIDSFTTLEIDAPIESRINIISSHGSKNIANTKSIHPSENDIIFNPDRIIGNGDILILLVCHSGSEKRDFFRNDIHSFVKIYLEKGYQAVVAPFWSLHIDIPPIWLQCFLELLYKGAPLSKACNSANAKVHEHFPTPAAWACMHLYGNPLFKLR